jgi:glutaryl-CoA dehydrogenase (non-decarboxylating)
MDFELPEELAEVQKLARDFAEKEIAPSTAKDDREHVFRKDLVGKMGSWDFTAACYRNNTAATASAFSPIR